MLPILQSSPAFSPLLYTPALWLYVSDSPATVTKAYTNITPTGSGTSGTSTITASATVATFVPIGAKLRIGGADIYTVTNVVTTTITISGTLSTNYVAQALAVEAVSQLNDKSTNGYNATQSTDSLKPVYVPAIRNNKDALWYGNSGLSVPSGIFPIPNGANTMFVVSQSTLADANDRSIITLSEGGSGRYVLKYSLTANEVHFTNNTSNTNPVIATGVTKANWNLFTTSFNGTTGLTIAVNSGSDFTASTGAAENGCNAAAIGANGGITTAFMRGYIGEVIIYNRLLNSNEIAQVKAYLRNQWGLL
jgi:hypothetical protein